MYLPLLASACSINPEYGVQKCYCITPLVPLHADANRSGEASQNTVQLCAKAQVYTNDDLMADKL